MKLNARQIETAKPGEKDYKLTDGNGLYLLVKSNGAKYWRFRYTFAGKEKMLAIGVYPAISLAAARLKRDEARQNVAAGVDPVKAKNYGAATAAAQAITFREIAKEWHEFRAPAGRQGTQVTFWRPSKKTFSPLWGMWPSSILSRSPC